MAIRKCKEEWGLTTYVESDISGCELKDDDMYLFDGLVMDHEELINCLIKDNKLFEIYGGRECDNCVNNAHWRFIGNNHDELYCDECLVEIGLAEYKTTAQDYADYIEEMERD